MPSDIPETNEAGPVDPMALRRVCGHFVTGVTVVTSGRGEQAAGTTVNSFTSVSLDPPLVLVCLHADSRLRAVVRETGAYVVNFLAERQKALAWAFANRATASMETVGHRPSATGVPVLTDALAYLSCRLAETSEIGDHTIFVGEVVDLGVPEPRRQPLVFFKGRMGSLGEDEARAQRVVDGNGFVQAAT
ncbi:flavin reductase family protein [Actinosynnema sp. NPDC050436]|uniref:flavin reductase family protein n=1 Tax=Actinosynnema sp. NPDC050436 TaxID=3155659 RepID=UPI0033FEE31B